MAAVRILGRHFPVSFVLCCCLLGASAKLGGKNFVMFVCPSVRMEQLGSHRMDFHEIWYQNILKFFEKIQD
jgi:hypothetical protein